MYKIFYDPHNACAHLAHLQGAPVRVRKPSIASHALLLPGVKLDIFMTNQLVYCIVQHTHNDAGRAVPFLFVVANKTVSKMKENEIIHADLLQVDVQVFLWDNHKYKLIINTHSLRANGLEKQ